MEANNINTNNTNNTKIVAEEIPTETAETAEEVSTKEVQVDAPDLNVGTTQKDIAIYGYGQIGKAIASLALKAKEDNIFFSSEIFTIDINGEAQYQSPEEIKDIPNTIIHVIAIDSGIELTPDNENGFIPDTYRIVSLMNEIFSERNNQEDIIIIESTVEIGFLESPLVTKFKEEYPRVEIIVSPERYLEDTQAPSGFTMDPVKLCGVEIHDPAASEEEYVLVRNNIQDYISIFTSNNIAVAMGPIKEVIASKVVENAIRYAKLAFVNEIHRSLSGTMDAEMVMRLIATKQGYEDYANITPGLIGGGCIPVDSLFIPDLKDSLISKVINDENKRFSETAKLVLKLIIGSKLKNIAMLGLSYKPNSSSTKNSMYKKVLANVNDTLLELDAAERKLHDTKNGLVPESEKEEYQSEVAKIYVIDHLSTDSPIKYLEKETLGTMDLILVGANHKFKERDYLALATSSGANVLDLNTLNVYKKGQ